MVGVPDGGKTLRIRITVYTQHQCVTDRQTSCHGIVRAMHTRRAVKTNVETLLGLMLNEKSARFRWKH